MLGNKTTVISRNDGEILLFENVLQEDKARRLLRFLLQKVDWEQHWVTVFGKRHPQPRLTAFWAADALTYRYSGLPLTSTRWPDGIDRFVAFLNERLDTSWNSCLLNYYRDGRDAMGWHADNEPELGDKPDVAILSLGAERRFALHHRPSDQKRRLLLPSGSLLLMRAPCQTFWRHSLPRMANALPRVSLTFRRIHKLPYTHGDTRRKQR